MNARYIFEFKYRRPNHKAAKKKVKGFAGELQPMLEFTETIVAETITQAIEHWKLDIMDEGVEFMYLLRREPVIAILP